MSDIEAKVKSIIAEKLKITEEEIIPDTLFFDQGGDSMTHVDIISAIETTFNIIIPNETPAGTFNEVLECVNELVE